MTLEFVSNNKPVFRLSNETALLVYDVLNSEPTVAKDRRKYANKGVFTVFYTNSDINVFVSPLFEFNFRVGDFVAIKI